MANVHRSSNDWTEFILRDETDFLRELEGTIHRRVNGPDEKKEALTDTEREKRSLEGITYLQDTKKNSGYTAEVQFLELIHGERFSVRVLLYRNGKVPGSYTLSDVRRDEGEVFTGLKALAQVSAYMHRVEKEIDEQYFPTTGVPLPGEAEESESLSSLEEALSPKIN